MESILTSIKKLLGITEEYEHFDADIILHINTAFSILNQVGYGPEEGFRIRDKTANWTDYSTDENTLNLAKDYVYMKVRVLFDTPSNSSLLEAMNRQISELEWRLYAAADMKAGESVNV